MQLGQYWRFLTPTALPFTLEQGRTMLVDRLTGAPPRPFQARQFVHEHATPGDPADVLRTLDRFSLEVRFLMSVGPEKGPLMSEMVGKLPEGARVLECGAYCGYSAVMIADRLPAGGRLVSVEVDPIAAEVARSIVDLAGYSDRVEVILGGSTETIPKLAGPFDLVFLDHWKELYTTDLQTLEKHALLRPGSVVVADNVGEIFGAEKYLDYVRTCGRYESEHRPATIEYTQIPDAVEISVYRGGN